MKITKRENDFRKVYKWIVKVMSHGVAITMCVSKPANEYKSYPNMIVAAKDNKLTIFIYRKNTSDEIINACKIALNKYTDSMKFTSDIVKDLHDVMFVNDFDIDEIVNIEANKLFSNRK